MPGSMMQPDLSGVTATGGTRAAALARWQDNGWPGPRVEAWRYTSLAKLSDLEIAPVASLAGSASGPGMAAATGIAAHVIRFENGVVDPAGLTGLPGGVTIGDLGSDEAATARLAELAPQLQIPLLVNGDISDRDGALQALEASGAAGVMVGRGAMGQPWIFAKLLGEAVPTPQQRLLVMARHLALLHEFYGCEPGSRIARKHMQAYLRRWGAEHLLASFMCIDTGAEQLAWLSQHSQYLLSIADAASADTDNSVRTAGKKAA